MAAIDDLRKIKGLEPIFLTFLYNILKYNNKIKKKK